MKFNIHHPSFVAALDLEPQEEIKLWQPRIQIEVIEWWFFS